MEHKGWLSETQLSALFNNTMFYIEPSFYEGLGLLALESAMCGAIPLARRNGAIESIFGDSIKDLYWSTTSELQEKIKEITEIPYKELEEISIKIEESIRNYSSETGKEKFIALINLEINKHELEI